MNWQRFLGPTRWKVILAIVIFLVLPSVPVLSHCICETGVHCPCPKLFHLPPLLAILPLIANQATFELKPSLLPLLGAVLSYLGACIALESKRYLKN